MHNMPEIKHRSVKTAPIMYDRLPEEGKKKVKAFGANINIYFKNQALAGLALKCSQTTINKYIKGVNLVPLEVARRFSRYTNGNLSEDSIFFDYAEWMYDQRIETKNKELSAA